MVKDNEILKLMNDLTLEEKIGQMLCYNLGNRSDDEVLELVNDTKAGGFFVANNNGETIGRVTAIMNKNLKIPGIIAADIEAGPGHILRGEVQLPSPMAWGACDDAKAVKEAHIATAERCRELGIHWSFSPIVDLNYNPDNPVTNIRAVSDIPEQVVKICGAAIDGLQQNGMVMAGCKHFPGDGMDDRNQHFCTTVNSMSKEDWMNTYGYVYREMFKKNAASVMVGHIALPSYDEKLNDWVGYPPGIVSRKIITDLLKGELGFEGCVVSDALAMVGACSAVPYDRLAVEFVKAGGDILLFPLKEYFYQIKDAVENGEISSERINDAVYRILCMKKNARLFENQEDVLKDITHQYNLSDAAQKIADESITLIRNYDNLFPIKLEKGSKILILDIKKDKEKETAFYSCDLDEIEKELQKRGYCTDRIINGARNDFQDKLDEYDLVLINCKLSSQDYAGGSLRIGWQHIAPFWRGAVLRHPKVVFTSFGCPYKIHDFPYLKTYINAYSPCASTQKAFVKAIFGEIPFKGKSPVSFKGYFKAEV